MDPVAHPASAAADLQVLLGGRARLLVLAPHPDDEIFGCAGLMQRALAARIAVDVVVVTDGDACDPALAVEQRPSLARSRCQESLRAAQTIGLGTEHIAFWHWRDGTLRGDVDALARAIATIAAADTCTAAPWHRDGHPDHDALGMAARRAQRTNGAALCEYLIWSRVWPQCRARVHAAAPRRFALTACEQRAKRSGAQCFQTQLQHIRGGAPVIDAAALQALTGPEEWFLCS